VHVDVCLNKGIIQELSHEASPVSQPRGHSSSAGELVIIKKNIIFFLRLMRLFNLKQILLKGWLCVLPCRKTFITYHSLELNQAFEFGENSSWSLNELTE
jgi:hypothetical protein